MSRTLSDYESNNTTDRSFGDGGVLEESAYYCYFDDLVWFPGLTVYNAICGLIAAPPTCLSLWAFCFLSELYGLVTSLRSFFEILLTLTILLFGQLNHDPSNFSLQVTLNSYGGMEGFSGNLWWCSMLLGTEIPATWEATTHPWRLGLLF